MKKSIPRVAALQDMSGFGRCSLTVIMPILACMGVQVCPLPTAVLSTHSGGFGEMAFTDLTKHMKPYMAHWKSLGLYFDCIYTGFIGNEEQIDLMTQFFQDFKQNEKQYIVVDPVMGDHGKLYRTYNLKMQEKMKKLVQQADIITPNPTEASFLLGIPYELKPRSEWELQEILKDLAALGPKQVVITGMVNEIGKKVNIAYDKEQNQYYQVAYEEIPVSYPGTGDAFTSVLIGALLGDFNLGDAIKRATQFVLTAIQTTYEQGTDAREGILLEKILPQLLGN
ncbi:pyridoxamine kinase [Sporanaerobium hydrogeniformans]|uniref:Pyridoxamine kinase n=1 Tax=Sporanaerobium hydrogeniformans TaxID=3072179 RepID=A0AC61D6U5_9FIRM|nr:pyridoxamine kinase [Sporanaerobium hydrogeniformans]PHV69354.1 pyridoxamine kinase [Sporanaerobium hydrogeniformans]